MERESQARLGFGTLLKRAGYVGSHRQVGFAHLVSPGSRV